MAIFYYNSILMGAKDDWSVMVTAGAIRRAKLRHVVTTKQTNQQTNTQLLRGRMLFLLHTDSVKALKGRNITIHALAQPKLTWESSNLAFDPWELVWACVTLCEDFQASRQPPGAGIPTRSLQISWNSVKWDRNDKTGIHVTTSNDITKHIHTCYESNTAKRQLNQDATLASNLCFFCLIISVVKWLSKLIARSSN